MFSKGLHQDHSSGIKLFFENVKIDHAITFDVPKFSLIFTQIDWVGVKLIQIIRPKSDP